MVYCGRGAQQDHLSPFYFIDFHQRNDFSSTCNTRIKENVIMLQ